MARLTIRDLCMMALFAAIIAVLAQITIPLPLVPLTMQTFAVALAGVVLGARKGALTVCLYVLLGAIGMPVFSAFQGGIGMLVGPAGGYILSFPLIALIVGLVSDRAAKLREAGQSLPASVVLTAGLALGIVVNLGMGTAYLSWVLQLGLFEAIAAGMLPFLVPELLKSVLVFTIAPKIRQVIDSRARA